MEKKLKILHISPTYFSIDSVLGGGERYVLEIAKAMSKYENVKILSFGGKECVFQDNGVKIKILKPRFYIKGNKLNPFVLNLFKEFRESDIIHVHQIHNFLTEICIAWAKLLGKPIFLTDHGGGGRTFFHFLKLSRFANGLLPVSEFSNNKLHSLNDRRAVIYGGVDMSVFSHNDNVVKEKNRIISVGRILPHKGFHHLIKAIDNEHLIIIGNIADEDYLSKLKDLAKNKNVDFLHNLSDAELKMEISKSSLAVFPSTRIGPNEESLSGEPELLGIAPLEAMALGVPTIVSDVGAYPEICLDKENFLFKNGNIEDLRHKINHFWCVSFVEKNVLTEHLKSKFTWDKAAVKCLGFYNQWVEKK